MTGTVTDASTGQPIANAKVEAQGVLENHPFSAMTDSNGIALKDSDGRDCIPAGNVTLRATANRYQPRTTNPVTVPSEGGVVVLIQLDCTQVRGRVIDDNGQPILGVIVILTASDGTQLTATTGGLDGTFVFDCVPHGAATV